MSNPMNASQTIAVPFYGVELFVVEHGPQPYTPMKPIAEGMGLDWRTQYRKLIQGDQQKDHADLNGQNDHAGLNHRNSGSGRRRWGITEIVMQLPGDDQRRAITCLPLRKLPGWLMTIHPNKVRPEIRENVIRYQNECDDALWDYWTKGQATRQPIPAKPLPKPRVPAPLPWPRWYYLFEADAFGIKGDPFEAGKVLARCHLLRLPPGGRGSGVPAQLPCVALQWLPAPHRATGRHPRLPGLQGRRGDVRAQSTYRRFLLGARCPRPELRHRHARPGRSRGRVARDRGGADMMRHQPSPQAQTPKEFAVSNPIPFAQNMPITMSSVDISELVESRHDKVKQSIERLAERGVISLPPLGEVKVQRERRTETVSAYIFDHVNKRDSFVVVAQLSPEFTARLVDRWQELEAAHQPPPLPSKARFLLTLENGQPTAVQAVPDSARLIDPGNPKEFADLLAEALAKLGHAAHPSPPRTAAPKPSQDAGELILYFIGQGGPEGRTPKDLAQRCWAFKKLSPDVRESVMAGLLDRGEIVQVPRGRGGRAYIRVEGSAGLDVSASPVKAAPGLASGLRVDGRGESP